MCSMQIGNLILIIYDRWQLLSLWYGCASTFIALAISPYPYAGPKSPSSFLLVQGIIFMSLSAVFEFYRRRTFEASLALVQQDRATYDLLWDSLRNHNAAELAELAELVKFQFLALDTPASSRDARSPIRGSSWKKSRLSLIQQDAAESHEIPRQVLPSCAGSSSWWIGGFQRLLSQLNHVYFQVGVLCTLSERETE